MQSRRLLLVQPPELTFHMEQGRPTCTIQLTNCLREHVAFKVKALNPNRFRASTPYGKMNPWSYMEITVTICGQLGDLPNMLHRETFSIYSLVVRYDDTPERIRTLFNTQQHRVDVFDLRVARVLQQDRNLNYIQSQRLLIVQPPELTFHMEQGRPTFTIQLTNCLREHVAFKVRALNPDRFKASTPYGKMNPWSYMEITVTMCGQVGDLINMLHRETFSIYSLVVSHNDTPERIRTLFNTQQHRVDVFNLRVARVLHQDRNLNIQQPDRNRSPWDLLRTGIIVAFSCLMIWYLVLQILSRLWAMISAITFLVVRMMRNKAVEAAEDWIWSTVLYLSLGYLATIWVKIFHLCTKWLEVGSRAFLDLLSSVFGHQERRQPRYRN